jgi:hypothetical protein
MFTYKSKAFVCNIIYLHGFEIINYTLTFTILFLLVQQKKDG